MLSTAMTKRLQSELIKRGYDLGPSGADGDYGRLTFAAVAAFQRQAHLAVQYPGTTGAKTLAALGIDEPAVIVPPWVAKGRSYLGLHEVRDGKKLDRLLGLNAEEIAWCGAFQGLIIGDSLPTEPLPKNMLGARNWEKFGRKACEIDQDPPLGAIAVFWRGKRDGWQGHVTQVAGHDKEAVHGLGGNQSNSVSIARIPKNRLLAYRWPVTFALPNTSLSVSTIGGTLSQNEA